MRAPSALLLLTLLCLAGLRLVAAPGLGTGPDGTVLLDGRPFRGIGVNYFDLFARLLRDPADTNHLARLHLLRQRDIPFARFMAGRYWPVEMTLWQTNRPAYLDRYRQLLASAEAAGIGLIPSFCWHTATVPDLVGEPVSAWGDPKSRTHAWMRDYVGELVKAGKDSPAVWAWEFGNEYNLPADLPNAAEHRPPVVPTLGTPATRSAADELTHAHIRTALREFAVEVRRHDPHRLLLSGNAFPRKSAWHQLHRRNWDTDTEAQWRDMLRDDNPPPLNTLTGRLYADDDLVRLPWAVAAAREARRPLFIGEFGVEGPDTPAARERFARLLAALERESVPLAALWVFDFDGQARDWSVTLANERAWQLDAIAAANRRLRQP